MNLTRTSLLAMMLGLAVMTTGCITTVTTPSYVRSGDILNLGLGGIKRNSTGTTLTGGDLTATITDSDGIVHDVQVIGTFRAYADHTSLYARDSLDRADTLFGDGNTEPYDGMWWATLKLASGADTPLPLATGPATIAITSAELIDTGGPNEGTLSSFAVEVLPGTRTPTQEEEYQWLAYRHQRVLTVGPNDLTGITEVGGFQVALTYNTAAVATDSPPIVYPRVVPYSHDPNITLIQSTVDNGDGTQTLTAMVTNPNGFVPNADLGGAWAIGKSTFDDLQFAVIVRDVTNLNNWTTDYWIEAAESFYIDLGGDPIATVSPVLGRSF